MLKSYNSADWKFEGEIGQERWGGYYDIIINC